MAYRIETDKHDDIDIEQEQQQPDDPYEVSCSLSKYHTGDTDAEDSQEQVDKVKEQLKKVEQSPVTPVDEHEVENSLNMLKVHDDAQETKNMDNYLLQTLDEIERRTEKLRETVREVETERLYLLESLNTLMQSQALVSAGEKDELELYMDRLTNRLLTINISVQIPRNPPQEESLQLVRTLLRKLQNNMRQGETDSGMIHRYLNSCMEVANGPVDNTFQGALLGCAVEDQKEIRKILTSMWEAKDDIDRQMAVLASMSLA
ncbi:BAG family molecular chaperone regulator 2-like [Patiria miniata]|uniref:BAG family molecular chaperone regulator 2 n=1 Tax=Patiria miniata TaxID=46514 RepID=A0A913ZZD8_PATMI|nr:BAG family molecular chaperone regulator 2-like [Patiria miniata]XP_038056940.1 BAG family molecular chaperone regulator 2-like [Patiria miniata]